MARILNVGPRPDPARVRERVAPAVVPSASPSSAPISDEEDSSIPFIEVGATTAKTSARPARPALPSILPLSRPDAKPPELNPGASLFRVSFRPLPMVPPPALPLNQRFPKELVSWHHPEHEISGQYRAILHEVEDQLGVAPGKSLLFTAAAAGAGTTSVLLNLALTCARREHDRVVIVDANFSAPALASRLGVAATPGMREVLTRALPLTWALQETGVPNLTVLTVGDKGGSPALDLWPSVLEHLRQRFDWVFVDTAAWLEGEQLATLAGPCTATYMVLRPNDFEAPHLDDMLTSVTKSGGRMRGYILAQA